MINVVAQLRPRGRQLPRQCPPSAPRSARPIASARFVVASAGNALDARGRDRAAVPRRSPGGVRGRRHDRGRLPRRVLVLRPPHRPASPPAVARPAPRQRLATGLRGRLAADPPAHLRLLSDELRQRPGNGSRSAPDVGTSMSAAHASAVAAWCSPAVSPGPTRARSGSQAPALHGVARKAPSASTGPAASTRSARSIRAAIATQPQRLSRASRRVRSCGRCRRCRGRGGRSCSARCRAGSAARRSSPCCRPRSRSRSVSSATVEDRVGGVALAGVGVDLDAGLAAPAPSARLEDHVDVLPRPDRVGDVARDLAASPRAGAPRAPARRR